MLEKKYLKEGLGKLQDSKAKKIYTDKHEQPYIFPPCPFAINKKVEEELDRLRQLGVIRHVQFSHWVPSRVPVMKLDGRVRICGDYKITINQAAKIEKYTIPRTHSLIHQARSFLQIPLEKDSCRYAMINTTDIFPFGVSSAPFIIVSGRTA